MRLLLDTNIVVSGLGYEHLRPYIHPEQARVFIENVEVLATAVAGEAKAVVSGAVVSGDRAGVLALGDVEGISIITAREALERLGLADD